MSFSKVLECIKKGNYVEAKTEIYTLLENGAISDEDILALEKYYNEGKSPYVGYFFYKALCSKNKYFEAYNVYMELMKLQIKKKDINFYDVSKGASDEDIMLICEDIEKRLDEYGIVQSLLISEVIDVIIPRLWENKNDKKYDVISNIARKMWFSDLKNTQCLYEFAYSCSKNDSELAKKLYLKLVESEPANSKALNQIGLIYEKNNDMKSAQRYFEKAYDICADNEEYRQNLERIYLATR